MALSTPSHQLELSIVNYLQSQNTVSGSLLSGSNITYYAGYNNQPLLNPPICIVDVESADEIAFNSRNYFFTTNVYIKEMAFDTSGSMSSGGSLLGVTAQAVLNEFADSNFASSNFTNIGSYNISVWQVMQQTPFHREVAEGALIYVGTYRIAGALTQ